MYVCVFSVVGPALTFRMRQNENNMTAADMAAKAGEETQTYCRGRCCTVFLIFTLEIDEVTSD